VYASIAGKVAEHPPWQATPALLAGGFHEKSRLFEGVSCCGMRRKGHFLREGEKPFCPAKKKINIKIKQRRAG
jgi:hypothetical protein